MKKIKFLTTILALSMLFTTLVKQPVHAVETIAPFYTNISYTTTSLTSVNGKASCTAQIVPNSSASLKIFMYLEKYTNGTWTPYTTFPTVSKTGTNLTTTQSVSVSSGTYRVKASYYAGSENTVKYSASKTF